MPNVVDRQATAYRRESRPGWPLTDAAGSVSIPVGTVAERTERIKVMRTAYAPKTHTELASASAGKAYGHVPGHQYHDVDVVISRSTKETAIDALFRCHIVESWGSAQGYDEEHGRREVVGRDRTIEGAASSACDYAKAAGMSDECLHQALSQAIDAALEA
jgi:hypothetical protein